MCDCATELERKRREIENRGSLKSHSLSGASSRAASADGGGDDDSPGLIRAVVLFLRGEMSFSEVAEAAGVSESTLANLGVLGGVVGAGAMLLAMLAVLAKFYWRRKEPKDCWPKLNVEECPPKILKSRLRWPPEDYDDGTK